MIVGEYGVEEINTYKKEYYLYYIKVTGNWLQKKCDTKIN
jgi:hypothetical protein